MPVYIHGFGSSAKGVKAMMVREAFAPKVIAPSLSPIPDLAIDTLEQIVEGLHRCSSTLPSSPTKH